MSGPPAPPERGGPAAPYVISNDGAGEVAALIREVADHADKRAFIRVFQLYGPRLKAYFSARGIEDASADDLVQDTMLILWRKASLFDPTKGHLSAWLFTIARNQCLNHMSARRQAMRGIEMTISSDGLLDGESEAIQADMTCRMATCMEQLPAEQRELLIRVFWRGMTFQQCAEQVNVPVGTAK